MRVTGTSTLDLKILMHSSTIWVICKLKYFRISLFNWVLILDYDLGKSAILRRNSTIFLLERSNCFVDEYEYIEMFAYKRVFYEGVDPCLPEFSFANGWQMKKVSLWWQQNDQNSSWKKKNCDYLGVWWKSSGSDVHCRQHCCQEVLRENSWQCFGCLLMFWKMVHRLSIF